MKILFIVDLDNTLAENEHRVNLLPNCLSLNGTEPLTISINNFSSGWALANWRRLV